MKQPRTAFFGRFRIYLRERFPLHQHGVIIAAFTFSVLAYSRLCRGAEDFVSWHQYVAAFINALILFFLLRVADEHKDASDDKKFRPELPVPRGLIQLKELRITGWMLLASLILFDLLYFPDILKLLLPVLVYLYLMTKEFFVAEWLKKRQLFYVLSHMLIIPLADFMSSGFDWMYSNAEAPAGLMWFFAVSFFNGILLEIGRKLRAPEDERAGVLTYSSMLGSKRAIILWLLVLSVNFILAGSAADYTGNSFFIYFLSILLVLITLPAFKYLRNPSTKNARVIEMISGIWTLLMYLGLGGFPMLMEITKA